MQTDLERFPSVSQAAVLLLANFLLQYMVSALFYDFRHALNLTSAQAQAMTMILSNGIVLVPVMLYRSMTYRDLIHPNQSSVSASLMLLVVPVLLLVPLVMLLNQTLMLAVQQLFPLSLWEEQAFASMVAGNLASVIATCILAPVLEEMLFRGILLRSFLHQYPRWAAISYSSLLFGVAHLNVYQFLLAFCLGLLLGWLYERSRSLIPCIALHAAVNTSVLALDLTKDAQGVSGLDSAGTTSWLLALAGATAGILILRRVLTTSTRKAADAV